MRILGIDPGYATVGFGVVDYDKSKFTCVDFGAIQTPAKTPFEDRLEQLFDEMTKLIGLYRPQTVAFEELFFNTNTTTAIKVAQGRGVLLLAARKSGLECFEYTPLQVKQAVVGYGRAEKMQDDTATAEPPETSETRRCGGRSRDSDLSRKQHEYAESENKGVNNVLLSQRRDRASRSENRCH